MLRSQLKAPLVLFRWALTSFWVPLSLLMRLLGHVKSSMHSDASLPKVNGGTVAHHLFFFWLMYRLLSWSDFSWRWVWVDDMAARLSAKTKSSRRVNKVHWIPRRWSAVVWRITQLMVIRNRIGERIQPYFTPDLIIASHSHALKLHPGMEIRENNYFVQ